MFEGLEVCSGVARTVRNELPFLAMEQVMVLMSGGGFNLQEVRAKLRDVSLEARLAQERGETMSLETVLGDSFFDTVFGWLFNI